MRLLKSSLAATAIALTCTLLHAQTAPLRPGLAAAPNTASVSTPIPPSKLAKIDEMLTLTGVKPTLLQTIEQGKKRINWYAKVQTGTLTQVPKEKEAKEQQITADYSAKMNSIAEAEMTWEKLKPSILRYCADNFTNAQLDGIIAFYKSPAGKAMLEKGPALNQRTYDALQSLQVHTKPLTDQATRDMKDKVQALIPPDSKSATPPTQSSAPSATSSSSSTASSRTFTPKN
jgi:hypothetical protein